MGQQQLLIIAFSTIVVGINFFTTSVIGLNSKHVISDLMNLASDEKHFIKREDFIVVEGISQSFIKNMPVAKLEQTRIKLSLPELEETVEVKFVYDQ